MTSGGIKEMVEAAAEFTPEPPRPLRRQLPPAEPFPVAALGSVLGPATQAIQERIQAPAAICAQSVLAAATLAVQGHADVLLPFGQRRPLSEFFITIADSGERKTSTDAEALTPIRNHEAGLRDSYRIAASSHKNFKAAWDAEYRRVLADRETGIVDKEAALGALGPEPPEPLQPLLTCPEPTYEGLVKLFAIGRPSLGVFSAEGGQFVGGYGMSADHRLKTSAALSSLWDGEPLRRVRSGDGVSMLPGRRLAMHLMVQPSIATGIISDPMLAEQGLLSRMLIVSPESTAGTRFWKEPTHDGERIISSYTAHLRAILDRPLPLREGTANELEPRILELTPGARRQWIAFLDHIERQLPAGGELEPIRAFSAKAAEHAARLGAILALVDDLDCPTLDEDHLRAGIALAQHYIAEWDRLHDSATAGAELLRAERLLSWLATGWDEPVIGLPEIYQFGPKAIRDAKAARSAVQILEEHGYLLRIDEGATVKGTYRRDAWSIVRG